MTIAHTQTTLVLVPDHRLLETDEGSATSWDFAPVLHEIEMVSAPTGPMDICLYLAFPAITMHQVDLDAVLECMETVSKQLDTRSLLVRYRIDRGEVRSSTQVVNSDRPLDRWLKVYIATAEVIGDATWGSVLQRRFQIALKQPVSGGPQDLLRGGFTHLSGAPFISLLVRDDNGERRVRHLTATGQ